MLSLLANLPKDVLVQQIKDGLVLLDMVQAPNGKILPSKALLNGKKIAEGSMLGQIKE